VIKLEYHNTETDERHEGEPDGPVLIDGLVVKTSPPRGHVVPKVEAPWDVSISVSYREANKYHEEGK
jgi:hypothetical protein